jgi:acyl dehydratase
VAGTMTMAELGEAKELDLGVSGWVEVTQEMIDRFAEATGDHQWIHVDPERAAEGPFGRTIAHGYLTLSLLPVLLGDLLQVTDATMGVNYGLDRLRLTSPVKVGARVRSRAMLRATEPKAGGLLVRLDVTVEIEGEDRPALVAEVLLLRYG